MLAKTIREVIEDLSKEINQEEIIAVEWFKASDFERGDNTPIPNQEQLTIAINRTESLWNELDDFVYDVIHETMNLCEYCNCDLGEDFNSDENDFACEECKREINE